MAEKTSASITVTVLFKKEGPEWVGHCLEFDIVATGTSLKKLQTEMKDLIIAQVEYAFTNDNLDYLFHPAPTEAWREFYRCKQFDEARFKLSAPIGSEINAFVPPWVVANMCRSDMACHA